MWQRPLMDTSDRIARVTGADRAAPMFVVPVASSARCSHSYDLSHSRSSYDRWKLACAGKSRSLERGTTVANLYCYCMSD